MGRTSDAGQRLIEAMARLAHRCGYTAVGVDEICREAGVKKGSFYYYFESKHDLMLAALKYQWQSLEPLMQRAFDPSRPPLERFAIMVDSMAEIETANKSREGYVLGCPFGRVAAELGSAEPALAAEADAALCGYTALYAATLAEARRAGQLDATVNVNEAAEAITAYVQGVALLAKTRNDPALIRRLGRLALRLAVGTPLSAAAKPRARR